MEIRNLGRGLGPYLSAFLIICPFKAFAVGPTLELKSSMDQVIKILNDPQLQGEAKTGKRHRLLLETILSRFAFKEMAKPSLGAYWDRRTLEEQREFVRIFTGWRRLIWE